MQKVEQEPGFLPVVRFFPVSIIRPVLHTDVYLNSAVIRRTREKSGNCSTKQCSLPDVGKQAFKVELQNIVARCYYDTDAQRGRILRDFETVRYTKVLTL